MQLCLINGVVEIVTLSISCDSDTFRAFLFAIILPIVQPEDKMHATTFQFPSQIRAFSRYLPTASSPLMPRPRVRQKRAKVAT